MCPWKNPGFGTIDYSDLDSELCKVDEKRRNYAGGIQLAIWQTSSVPEEMVSWSET